MYAQPTGTSGYQMMPGQPVDTSQGYYDSRDANKDKKRKIRASVSDSSEKGRQNKRRRDRSPSLSSDVN